MTLFTDTMRALVARHEGCRLHPYADTAGLLTVGYGHNLTRPITQAQAEAWLDDDLAQAVKAARSYPWFVVLSDQRQAVIVDILFNVGAARFTKFVRLIAALEVGAYDTAAREIEDSHLAPARRTELAAMMGEG